MNTRQLNDFVDRVMSSRKIERADVEHLARDVLPDGIITRENADVLIALDRAVACADPSWADYLVAVIVDYAVWGARPTGTVDADTSAWLATSLSCGGGPTATALRVGFEIVREAQQVDEVFLAFVMRSDRKGLGQTRRRAPMAA